ncbi:23028_t:CDS:2, partial [Gigaspora rosea]
MTAVLRTKIYMGYKVLEEYNTHIYFKSEEAQLWQLKHYLGFRLKFDDPILPWSNVYEDWQNSLNLIARQKKIPGCITVFCKSLLELSNNFEGSIIMIAFKGLYDDFYQKNQDKQISERIRLLDSIFSERKFSEFLRINSSQKRKRDSEEFSSSSEKRIRHEDNVPSVSVCTQASDTEEITQPKTVRVETSPFNEWILSTGKNVNEELKKFRSNISNSKKAYLYPAFFGILDLSGEDTEVKELFTDKEWSEMKADFNKTVELKEVIEDNQPEGETLYDLFDKIEEAINKKPDDLITAIEKCTIEGSSRINSIRRLIQTYAYNLERLQTSTPEAMFSNNFTNMLTKGILTYHQKFIYDEGEIQSIASAFITNSTKKPTDRSLIGQKCDFRVTRDGFEMVIGLRSGGLPEACKSKKYEDKIDLVVAMRDVLLQEAIENNGVELFYNVYALDWKSRGLWRLGLLKKTRLPQSNSQLLMIEKLVVTLLRIELTLNHIESIRNDLAVKASRLHRRARTSIILEPYADCEQR